MKTPFDHSVVAALLAGCFAFAAVPANAASSAASSASDSASTSVGSVSDSLKKSSDSSSKTVQLAEGDYRVIDIATVADRPGIARITLAQAAAPNDDDALTLDLPQQAVDNGRLAAGQSITARQREYGFELASGTPLRAFFLVLADDWYRELQTRAVVL